MECIGHYTQLPDGWFVVTLKELCENINGLWKGKKEPFVNVGVIRNANFTKDFKLDYSNIEYIDVEQRTFAKRHLENGDLIVEKSVVVIIILLEEQFSMREKVVFFHSVILQWH